MKTPNGNMKSPNGNMKSNLVLSLQKHKQKFDHWLLIFDYDTRSTITKHGIKVVEWLQWMT